MVGGFLFLFSKSYKNNFQNIELETSFQIIIFILYVYCSHFFLKNSNGELKNETTPIRPWELARTRNQEWLYLAKWSSKGIWVVHEESTWTTPWHLENSIEIYLQELVNWTTCYYFEAWVKSWFIAITSYSVLNFQRQL